VSVTATGMDIWALFIAGEFFPLSGAPGISQESVICILLIS
jgi:hypothetical protein